MTWSDLLVFNHRTISAKMPGETEPDPSGIVLMTRLTPALGVAMSSLNASCVKHGPATLFALK